MSCTVFTFLEPTEPRETSFLFSDGNQPESLSPSRNKLRNIAPLPSKPTIETLTNESETFKEKIEDLDTIIEKVSNIDDDQDEQKKVEFEFFTGGFNQKFDSFVQKFGHSSKNIELLDFLSWDYSKEILENNDLQIHVETGKIYYKNTDTNESIFEFMKNQQDSSKGEINSELSFEGNYNDYYRWILNDYDAYEKTKFDH